MLSLGSVVFQRSIEMSVDGEFESSKAGTSCCSFVLFMFFYATTETPDDDDEGIR